MPDHPGIFIVLEGADGSGKTTQFRLLEARLKALGYDVEVFDFPRYDNPSSYFVSNYLNGEYGPAKDLNPYTASLFYALDRYEAGPVIKKALKAGKVVLSNRYVGSNMAHQGSKFDDATQQRGFFVWEDNLEYELLGIPRPSLNIFLRVPAEVSYGLIKQKAARSYTNKKYDEHEGDINHLRRAVGTYDLLCQLFPKDFLAIDCAQGGQLLSIPQISNLIWSTITPLLPANKPNPARSLTVKLNVGAQVRPTSNSSKSQDSTDSLIYETQGLSLLAVGIVSAAGCQIIKDWPTQKGLDQYYSPVNLPKGLNKVLGATTTRWSQINKQLDEGLKHYSKTAKEKSSLNNTLDQSSEARRLVTPLAVLVPATIIISRSQSKIVIEELLSSNLSEMQKLADELRLSASLKWPEDFKETDADYKSQPAKIRNIISKMANEQLSQTLPGEQQRVKLLKVWPRNEFEILADSLYSFSNLERNHIQQEVEGWDYQRKHEALKAISGQASAVKGVRYHLDVICDWSDLLQLRKSGLATDLKLQPATPRYGYEVPKIIELANLEDLYMEAFDESFKLYSAFQSASQNDFAGYGLLAGHKTRVQFATDAAALAAEFVSSTQTGDYQSLLGLIKTKVAQVHPLLWGYLSTPRASVPPATKIEAKKRRRRQSRSRKNSHS